LGLQSLPFKSTPDDNSDASVIASFAQNHRYKIIQTARFIYVWGYFFVKMTDWHSEEL